MDLKELLGEAYQEGMTAEDVKAYFKKQVLESGEYVNKGKAEAEKKAAEDSLSELKKQLQEKMTEDEKKKAADVETQNLIKKLQEELAQSKSTMSRNTAQSSLAEAKIKAGIKDNDKDFEEFISNIAFEDNEKTDKVSKYISKIVASAYEAGKSETVKNKLGKMGTFKEGQDGTKGSEGEEKGAYGKELAQQTKVTIPNEKNFFERK